MSLLLTSCRATVFFLIVCGLLYPLTVTGLAHLFFPFQSGGELVTDGSGTLRGSRLIGQDIHSPAFFHSRPSATPDPSGSGSSPDDGLFSSPSNLGPDNAQQIKAVNDLAQKYRQENGLPAGAPVPVDAVTASGSGLDPDISVANALAQASRVATARHLPVGQVRALVLRLVKVPQEGLLGVPRVNVLTLNLALARLAPSP